MIRNIDFKIVTVRDSCLEYEWVDRECNSSDDQSNIQL